MWGKVEQSIVWVISYIPVLAIGLYRYFFEELDKSLKIFGFEISNNLLDILILILILSLTITIFFNAPKLIFLKLDRQMKKGNKGNNYTVKKFDRLNLNDYTFFLLTLILPLITVDYASTISLIICFAVIFFIIALLVSIDYIIACPLFFVSPYKVWKVKMEEDTESKNKIEKDVFVITRVNDFFDREFRAVKLIKDVYYLTESNNSNK